MGVWRRTEVLVGVLAHDEREREVRVDLAQVEHLRRLVLAAPVQADHGVRVHVRYRVAAATRARQRARHRTSASSLRSRVHVF